MCMYLGQVLFYMKLGYCYHFKLSHQRPKKHDLVRSLIQYTFLHVCTDLRCITVGKLAGNLKPLQPFQLRSGHFLLRKSCWTVMLKALQICFTER